jgi:2'-5' RNA ligase
MRRLFFALWPESQFVQQLLRSSGPWLATASGRALLACDLHVTLCFIGAASDSAVERLCEHVAVLALAPFTLHFGAFEYWRKARVLAATAASSPAGELAAQALAAEARQCGLNPDIKAFRPHVTLMRGVAAARPDAIHAAWPAPPMALSAVRFWLAESDSTQTQPLAAQGSSDAADSSLKARYRRLYSWPLRLA